jgi:aminotransferase
MASSTDIPVARRVRQVPVSATKEMPMLAARVGGCVSLGQGVPSFATPRHVVDAVALALREEDRAGKYSLQPGLPELRKAVAHHLESEKGIATDPEGELAITAGAMEGLLMAIFTLVEREDEVILPSPTYASYIEQVLLAEGTPVFVPLRKKDWGLDVAAVEEAITPKTRAVVVCNPSNPTGAVYSDSEVRALAELARERGIYLIFDETYDYLVYGGEPTVSAASLPGAKEWVISVFSFSKRYAMTGWRVGFVMAPAELLTQMLKVHDAAVICAPTVSQYAALAAITGPQDPFADMRDRLRERRDLCCRRLDALAPAFDYVRPGGAFYVMARHPLTGEPDREVALRILNEARVITVPGDSFGPGGEGHLRLSFGGTEDELNEAFDRLERWVQKLG